MYQTISNDVQHSSQLGPCSMCIPATPCATCPHMPTIHRCIDTLGVCDKSQDTRHYINFQLDSLVLMQELAQAPKHASLCYPVAPSFHMSPNIIQTATLQRQHSSDRNLSCIAYFFTFNHYLCLQLSNGHTLPRTLYYSSCIVRLGAHLSCTQLELQRIGAV